MNTKPLLALSVVLLGAVAVQAQHRNLLSHPRRERGTQAPGFPCDGDQCTATWSKCFGKAFDAVSPCCPGDICVAKNVYYAQCRPESYSIPSGWDGSILECGQTSLTGSGTAGEFTDTYGQASGGGTAYGGTGSGGYGTDGPDSGTAGAGGNYGETAGGNYGETAGGSGGGDIGGGQIGGGESGGGESGGGESGGGESGGGESGGGESGGETAGGSYGETEGGNYGETAGASGGGESGGGEPGGETAGGNYGETAGGNYGETEGGNYGF